MNIKYNELSIIGKVWSIAELLFVGLRDNNKKYVDVAFSKLESLKTENIESKAVLENGIETLIENATTDKQLMLGEPLTAGLSDDGSIISTIWFDCIELQDIKRRVKKDCIMESDIEAIEEIYYEIHSLWINDVKNKELSAKERRDLFKIQAEIKSFKEKIEKRAERNQITII